MSPLSRSVVKDLGNILFVHLLMNYYKWYRKLFSRVNKNSHLYVLNKIAYISVCNLTLNALSFRPIHVCECIENSRNIT